MRQLDLMEFIPASERPLGHLYLNWTKSRSLRRESYECHLHMRWKDRGHESSETIWFRAFNIDRQARYYHLSIFDEEPSSFGNLTSTDDAAPEMPIVMAIVRFINGKPAGLDAEEMLVDVRFRHIFRILVKALHVFIYDFIIDDTLDIDRNSVTLDWFLALNEEYVRAFRENANVTMDRLIGFISQARRLIHLS